MPNKDLSDIIEEKKRAGYRLKPEIPADMSLDLSSACNQACLFCPNSKQRKPLRTMPLTLARRIMAEAFSLGVRQVGLYSTGEPFLIPNFHEYVSAAHGFGYEYIYVTTNGSLLDEETLRRVLDAGLHSLKFSINAYGRENYRFIHGRDHFHRVMESVAQAVRLKEEYRIKVFISCVTTRYSAHAHQALRERFAGAVDEVVVYPCTAFNGLATENQGILADVMGAPSPPCYLPFHRVCVTPEGYLSACCGDYQNYLAVADLSRQGIADAWHGRRFEDLRRRHLENDLAGTLCHACVTNTSGAYAPLVDGMAFKLDDEYYSPRRLRQEIERRLDRKALP